ncbi:NF038129 family PEP-CTERM protein [Luteolibacter sp. LG18]|uniref:NF038129 family PEP-CTERM protein n=1 Tax=Luteolibacter sp. LG18 TaxID=2819286 RepID=UPI002B2C5126|nr:hypothetical protein llg_22570 [Luteolibacter sp. LG18]
MKSNPLLLLATGLLLSVGSASAALYHVSIDTSALTLPANSGSGPFSLDFQLNSGATTGNNTATISNFNFGGGGGPFDTATLIGGASGSLPGTITLTDTNAFNEFYQSFTAGSVISFDLNLTENIDSGAIPDSFSFSILDGSLANIPTTGFGDTLLQVDIAAGSNVNLSSATGSYAGVSVTAVPEPSSALLGLVAVAGGVLRRRRRSA